MVVNMVRMGAGFATRYGPEQGQGMDRLRMLFTWLKEGAHSKGNFLGLLNVLIGRQIADGNGQVVSAGLSWRELAAWLKRVRWDRESVRELGLDPDALPPRDRERFWYMAIAHAQVSSAQAVEAGERLAKALTAQGYIVGPPPGGRVVND
jgi:hypothetical protein